MCGKLFQALRIMSVYNFWVPKEGQHHLYTFGEDWNALKDKQLIFKCEELPTIAKPQKGLFGIYLNKTIGVYPFRVALYDKEYIANYNARKHEKVFWQECIGEENKDNPYVAFAPIIHVVQGLDRKSFYEGIRPAQRFFRIMDSGIWNYFVAGEDDFKIAVEEIWLNWEKGYYKLLIAKEFADLNARLTRQSYLYEEEDSGTNSGHAADVSPYLFHSESQLKIDREKDEKDHLGDVYDVSQYQWRVLLLDDRIKQTYLKPVHLELTKEKILRDRIELMMGKDTCKCVYLDDDPSHDYSISTAFEGTDYKGAKVVMLCVDTIEKAECALKNYKFDFVFLDYLIKNDNTRRYGYELLKVLDDTIGADESHLLPFTQYSGGKQFVVGPDHRYFFMFISAFTTAISERLRLSGWSRSEELWHIAEGACPTNTPQLFCYNLRKMMVKRIKDSGMETILPKNILKLASIIYLPAKDAPGNTSVRKRAIDEYPGILSLLYHYNRILHDVEFPASGKSVFTTRGSVLMTTYIQDKMNLGGLLEHLLHLVHITAFGTVRQWPEMWEEYLFFKAQFNDLIKDKSELEARDKLYGNIERHILDLKTLD